MKQSLESMESRGDPSAGSFAIEVLFFARARELAGVPRMALELPASSTTADCVDKLVSQFPALREITGAMVLALNHEYVSDPIALKPGDEVALIPPVSGG